jgi:hypothetical protein
MPKTKYAGTPAKQYNMPDSPYAGFIICRMHHMPDAPYADAPYAGRTICHHMPDAPYAGCTICRMHHMPDALYAGCSRLD